MKDSLIASAGGCIAAIGMIGMDTIIETMIIGFVGGIMGLLGKLLIKTIIKKIKK